jgi:hypothetical protein
MSETLITFSEFVAQQLGDSVESGLAQTIINKLASVDTVDAAPLIAAAYYVRDTFASDEMTQFYMRNYIEDHHSLLAILHRAGLTAQEKAIVVNAIAGKPIMEIPPME